MSQKKPKAIFVTGGTRSGKSQYALEVASSFGKRKAYLATAEALDDEMQERIEKHRQRRGKDWTTIEEPLSVNKVLVKIDGLYDVVVLDCVTIWISNLLTRYRGKEAAIIHQVERLAKAAKEFRGTLVMVSNEVGMGIVPKNRLARQFRDLSGYANQKLAGVAEEVVMMIAGVPLKVK
jgi:adenosylcobinamide kinase/adenosylcobinamide-phosphate guanylyltransferase